MVGLILDPYIVKAVTGTTPAEIAVSFEKLYPEYALTENDREDLLIHIKKWLEKLTQQKPGRALSTGRRNSLRGELTCALLDALGVVQPKGVRFRMKLAWNIIDSPVGKKRVGTVPELDAERPDYAKD